jgi:hypothetical protein
MRNQETRQSNIPIKVFILSLVIFGASQLLLNSILTPLGSKLHSLNTEKEHLLEENREIAEQIAKHSSLRVIENLSEKKLNLSQEKQQTFIYVEDSSLVADKSHE